MFYLIMSFINNNRKIVLLEPIFIISVQPYVAT